ncbi:MAG TPA: hypothetical protein VM925_20115 [Labilithrix sp.]|nr:hypothetical protein [Labilithrix sp.]
MAMAILYGAPLSGLSVLGLGCASVESRAYTPFAMLGYPLAFLFLGSVIIAPMWNRRAERERKKSIALR